MSKGESSIKTFIRIRPPETNCVFGEGATLNCCDRVYHFDHVFPAGTSDEQIFERIGSQLVENTLKGLNSTLFAYGQTGTGKTYTMTGNSVREGLVQKTVALLLRRLLAASRVQGYSLRLNYIEIYNESVRDLLAEKENRIVVREGAKNGFYVEGVEAIEIRSAQEFNSYLQRGLLKRSVKSTKMNEVSSRSHTILTVLLEAKVGDEGSGWVLRQSKLNFVDLAGSQKQKQTDVSGSKLKQASSINKSLTTLSLVISKLADKTVKAAHIPYRESVLTKLLKDSVGGNSVTAFIGTISAQKAWLAETLSTLLFLQRLKSVRNVVEVNEKVEGKEEDLLRVIASQQQRIKELQQKISQLQQDEQDYRSNVRQLQADFEHAQLQIRQLEERVLQQQNPIPSFFTHFQQEQPQQSSFFGIGSQQLQEPQCREEQQQEYEENENENQKDLSVIPEGVAESEQPNQKQCNHGGSEEVKFQTEVKSKRQARSSLRLSTTSGKVPREGKSMWQIQSEFLRQEIRRYAEDEKVYGDFVQLISQNMNNFQFAAAQILIMRAQAERLTRTETHLQAYRAKLAQLTTLAEAHCLPGHSQGQVTSSLQGTGSNYGQWLQEEKQLLIQLERAKKNIQEAKREKLQMEETHRVQLFRMHETLLREQEEHQKTTDQLQFLKDENSRLANINQLYLQELNQSTTSETYTSSQSEEEIQHLRQKVSDLQDIIENDFISAIEELQLDIKGKNDKIIALSQENQALRENICALETTIDDLRLRCSELQAAQGQQCLHETHTLLAAQHEALCRESELDKALLRQLQAQIEQAREQVRVCQQRLRSQEESHRQAQTYFRYELKVRKAEASKIKEEWTKASADRELQAKKHWEACQTIAALQKDISQLTARTTDLEVQLEETKSLRKKAERQVTAEKARVQNCVSKMLRATKLYRSEEHSFSRFKHEYMLELEELREQNRLLQERTTK